jgi:hypothetical protein
VSRSAPPGSPTRPDEEDFLARWSRRKQLRREEPETAELPAAPEVEELPAALTDEDMPPLEVLDENSDFSGFMSPEVSEGLRKLALRKLFQSAGFNLRDGLDDYDEDFTSFAKLGDLITCDMRFSMEQEARAAAEAADEVAGLPEAQGQPAVEPEPEQPAAAPRQSDAVDPSPDQGEAPPDQGVKNKETGQ